MFSVLEHIKNMSSTKQKKMKTCFFFVYTTKPTIIELMHMMELTLLSRNKRDAYRGQVFAIPLDLPLAYTAYIGCIKTKRKKTKSCFNSHATSC